MLDFLQQDESYIVVVVVFTLKTVLTSIQYLIFLTLQGKETNLRGHKLTQNKAQKNKDKIKKAQRKSQHLKISYRFLKIITGSEKNKKLARRVGKPPKRK